MEQEINISQNNNQEILISSNDPQLIRINNNEVQDILINQNENQNLNISQPENQLLLIDGGGNVIGITDVLVNGVTVVSDNVAYITVPTKTSQLTNDSGYLTHETDPTVPSYIKQISLADINSWNSKQDELISGSTIKTINNTSILGSGNLEITGVQYEAGNGINIENDIITNTVTSYNNLSDLPTIPTKTSDLLNDNNFVSENQLSDVAFSGDYNDLDNLPSIPQNTSDLVNDSGYIDKDVNDLTNYTTTTDLNSLLGGKQDTLVSGTNIKTINNESILGSGNITISSGTSTDVQINGTSITSGGVANIITESSYNASNNKIATMSDLPTIPTIGNGTLTIQKNGTNVTTFTANSTTNTTANITVPTTTSELTNNSNFVSNTDYATSSIGGVIKMGGYGLTINDTGKVYSDTLTYSSYGTTSSGHIISKGTLENVLTGKGYITSSSLPTKTSDLTNDSGFIDKNVNDLTYYTLTSNLSSVATSGSYTDLSNTPTIPTATSQLTNTGADGTHPYIPALDTALKGLGVSSGRLYWEYGSMLTDTPLANYSDIPTKTSELTNDGSDGAHPFVPNNDNLGVYGLKALTSDGLNLQYIIGQGNTTITLQDKLVSGTNIKTINNNSLLGSGDITINTTPTDVQVNGTSITTNNVANLITNTAYNSSSNKIATMSDVPTNVSQLNNDSYYGKKTDVEINGISISRLNTTNTEYIADIQTNSAYNSSTNKIATMNDIPKKNIISVKPSADVSLTAGNYVDINNLTATTTIGSGLSISNGKIKIGSGISYVKVTVCMGVYANTNDTLYSFLTQNGTNVSTWLVTNCNGFSSFTRNDIISVSENDLISFNIYLGSGGTLGNDRTSIIVESV